MTFFKSVFSHLAHKHLPVVATNIPLDAWCRIDGADPTRYVHKVELCTALVTGKDAWGEFVDKSHHHTFLRVFLAPASDSSCDATVDAIIIERVLSTGGSYHSVTPISETFSSSGTFFRPDIHDRVCIISDSSSTPQVVGDLQIERTVEFGDGDSDDPRVTLVQFAQILNFISRTTMFVCAGGDCTFQSRSFSFTCMAALTPRLPIPTMVRNGGEEFCSNVEQAEVVDDSVFELIAEAFLSQMTWLMKDSASLQTLSLIRALKEDPHERAEAILYH